MKKRYIVKINTALEPWFPERRLFLRSKTETRFIRLRSGTQFLAVTCGALVFAWTIVATAILLMDSIGSGNVRDHAMREQTIYEARLNALSTERELRASEALAAHERFGVALAEISQMQSALLASEDRRKELETGIEVIQSTLRRTMKERDAARAEARLLLARTEDGQSGAGPDSAAEAESTGIVDFLTIALDEAAAQRDTLARTAADAQVTIDDMTLAAKLVEERNDRIFTQLEEAVSVSLTPLDKMFRAAGLPTDRIIDTVRQGYSGQGGPLMPLSFSTKGQRPDADSLRANGILESLDRVNIYRIAAQKLPLATPVKAAYRLSSSFGYRRDPKTGGSRMHNGLDMAGPKGTPILAPGDGKVTFAGWKNGYGWYVEVQHDFGIQTRYAHMAKIRVKVGDRVSPGDRIGDMGSSGRSTGSHLHYEVRVSGKPVNPMTYIKAARDVF